MCDPTYQSVPQLLPIVKKLITLSPAYHSQASLWLDCLSGLGARVRGCRQEKILGRGQREEGEEGTPAALQPELSQLVFGQFFTHVLFQISNQEKDMRPAAPSPPLDRPPWTAIPFIKLPLWPKIQENTKKITYDI